MNIFARLLPKQFLLFFFLTFLLVACGGGGGSSGGGIPDLQGLWIQQNSCGCSVRDEPGRPADRRCFFYFAGDRAVSGYLSATIDNCAGSDGRDSVSATEATSILNRARGVSKDNIINEGEAAPITAAAGTVFAVPGGSGGDTYINFIYAGNAGNLGRERVCSIYNRAGSTLNLGRGTPGDRTQTERDCNARRYVNRDPYFSP